MDELRRPTKLTLVPNRFAGVARTITKDAQSPDWIVTGLQHFSDGISPNKQDRRRVSPDDYRRMVGKTLVASDMLMNYLPAFQHLPMGFQCPRDIAVVLDALPRIMLLLEKANPMPRAGHRRNSRQGICAGVIVEIWKLVHGKVEPRNQQLYEACGAYWNACGNPEIGATVALENWRRAAERASGSDNAFFREVLIAVQNTV